jgi:transcriptional regulator with XRE-family HTH domain
VVPLFGYFLIAADNKVVKHYNMEINYGKRLKQIRHYKDISQFKLEVAAELAPGMLSRIENGKVNPTKETLLRLALAMGLTFWETVSLFGLDTVFQTHRQPYFLFRDGGLGH